MCSLKGIKEIGNPTVRKEDADWVMIIDSMQIILGEVWTCGMHANEQTHMDTDMAERHATLISHYIYNSLLRVHIEANEQSQ